MEHFPATRRVLWAPNTPKRISAGALPGPRWELRDPTLPKWTYGSRLAENGNEGEKEGEIKSRKIVKKERKERKVRKHPLPTPE